MRRSPPSLRISSPTRVPHSSILPNSLLLHYIQSFNQGAWIASNHHHGQRRSAPGSSRLIRNRVDSRRRCPAYGSRKPPANPTATQDLLAPSRTFRLGCDRYHRCCRPRLCVPATERPPGQRQQADMGSGRETHRQTELDFHGVRWNGSNELDHDP